MTSEQRFAGNLGGHDYDLVRLACPHYDDLQKEVQRAINSWSFSRDAKTINILELGAGTGETTKRILSADPRIKVTALDNEPQMIQTARENLKDHYDLKGRISYVLEDAKTYLQSQGDRSFHIAVSAETMHNWDFDYREEVVADTFRVLKRDGLLVIADKIATRNPALHREAFEWQMEQFKALDKIGRPDLNASWRQHYLEDEVPWKIWREDGLVADLKSFGFEEIFKTYRRKMEAVYTAVKKR